MRSDVIVAPRRDRTPRPSLALGEEGWSGFRHRFVCLECECTWVGTDDRCFLCGQPCTAEGIVE